MIQREWRLTVLIFLALAMLPLCLAREPEAGNFTITAEPVKDRIAGNEWAVFDLIIKNSYRTDDFVKISIKEEGVEWSVITEATVDYATGFTIRPLERKKIRILLKQKDLRPSMTKPYVVSVDLMFDKKAEKKTAPITIFVLEETETAYESDIAVTPNIPRYIDPRNKRW